MGKLYEKYQLHKNVLLPVLGVLAVAVFMLPYVLLGKGSYVQIHDQIDGEILNYIYQAKYLFKGDTIPEFMNGMSKAAMTPPAPFGVLFYVILSPFAAFVVMQWLAVLTGFLGMFYLCKRLRIAEEIGFVVGLLFAFMPFYPTYGLAALGQPMLILCFWELIKGKRRWLPLLGIVAYAGFSSLTLVGYVWICLGVPAGLWMLMKKRPTKGFAFGWSVLVGTYVLTNLELFGSLLGEGFTTHREEMVLNATGNLWERFLELLFVGGSYSNVYSVAVFVAAVVLCVGTRVYSACKKRVEKVAEANGEVCDRDLESVPVERAARSVQVLLLVILLLTVCAVLWNCQAIVALRKAIGGMVTYFQADRVYWIFPFLWMIVLAFVLQLLGEVGKGKKLWLRGGMLGICFVLLAVEGYQIFRDSNFNKNIRLLLVDGYEQVTWESLYMEEVFARIDEVIGEDKESHSVVSLGMYPSVALYNGYTCADGYSNNYDLAYKHAFRRIQAAELAKNEEVRKYFDDWGNRLYLLSAEYGMNGMLAKTQQIEFSNLAYDTAAMKDLNIKYVFAAAPVTDAEDLGWTLVSGSPFASESSYYEVWVYMLQ